MTISKLVEEGKISLDDPVSKYLPEFSTLWVLDEKTDSTMALHKAKNVLTVRMCLNHTGGFPFEIKRKTESNPYAPMTEAEMLAKLEKSREQGMFRDADLVVADMRLKYGL